MKESESEIAQSYPTVCNPWTVTCTRLLRPWHFPGKSTGVGCHFLLQGLFLTQRSNLGLQHCRQMLYPLSHQGSYQAFPITVVPLIISRSNISSVQFSRSVVSDSLQPHELQHARPPCPSPTPSVHSDSGLSSQWCHPAISYFASITSHIHSWVLFLLWLHPFFLSGVISPLISSSILDTYWPSNIAQWKCIWLRQVGLAVTVFFNSHLVSLSLHYYISKWSVVLVSQVCFEKWEHMQDICTRTALYQVFNKKR